MVFSEYKEQVERINLDDYAALLNISRKWEKVEYASFPNVRIAIIGTISLQLIVSVMRTLLVKYDLYAEIYEGEYDGIFMDVLDKNSKMFAFSPDYIIILPDYHDIINNHPKVLDKRDDVVEQVNSIYENYNKIFSLIHDKLPSSQIIMANFVEPFWGALGNLESNYFSSQKSFFRLVNITLTEKHPSYVSIVDAESLAEYIGKKNWFDESGYFLHKMGFALPFIGFYCDLLARQFEGCVGRIRKCLVFDLDNTIWGGAVGDLGYDGIELNPNDAEGEAYQAFQKYLLELKNRGVILAVCSKNDEKNAKEPFVKNPHMILTLEDISVFIANWTDKASNIKAISNVLNIGTDSMAFFDDNPAERELVKEFLPEVKVIDVPDDPALYIRALDQSYVFEWRQITEEDLARTQSYANNRQRASLMDSCIDYEDYLQKLQMRADVDKLRGETLSRFAQLTNKSNQFNLRTNRYSEANIEEMRNNPLYELLAISLTDKFNNYGIIACVILRIESESAFIENWVMSCRVLKRTIENYTIYKIIEIARNRKCTEIRAEYIPTKKNGMVCGLYESFGFQLCGESNGVKQYILKRDQIEMFKQTYFLKEDGHGNTE